MLPSVPEDLPTEASSGPLLLLLIIDALFEWVGMDLVGLLPKSAQGHKYTLVFMDSHIPKTSLLQKTCPASQLDREMDQRDAVCIETNG